MAALAEYLKKTDPTAKVVFIGPCTAKKDLSVIAPKGHWYTQAPHWMHLLSSMAAALSSVIEMAFTLQAT